MIIQRFLTLMIALLVTTTAYPQIRRCATMEQDSLNRARYPERGTLNDFERSIQSKIKELAEQDRKNGRTQATVLTIAVVVHVVHKGEAIGTGSNLSLAQIQSQIEVLNEDFRRKVGTPGYNNNAAGADIEIEFCLSPVDNKGNTMAEPGVHRYNGGQDSWTRNQIDGTLKPLTIWEPEAFYNIWTLKFGGEDANLLGYAQFPDKSGLEGLPSQSGDKTDGVVIQYTSFGSADKGTFPIMSAPYNKGRTLTHETGHYLGLRHIWGDGVCGNDYVDDTPTQRDLSRGCPTNKLACDGVTPAMVQNYMDYSDDACMNIFTNGQKARIRAVMNISPRRNRLNQNNHCNSSVTQPPVASFSIQQQRCILLGSAVTFNDLSSNFPKSWVWQFENGNPSTSTERNPKVKYNTPGSHNVSLIAKNDLGSDTLALEDFITISEEGLCQQFSNFKDTYTPSALPLSDFGAYTGFLTGHNSPRDQAFSEFFVNDCGYYYISGARVWFRELTATDEQATVTVTLWNARGPQNSPGAILEQKQILIKQIKADIAANRPTEVVFDRETTSLNMPFHLGVEITYNSGYRLAIESSANDEGTTATSWVKSAGGDWKLFTLAYGANIAMHIDPLVGVNPSVQVSASQVAINPGQQVVLNGKGASVFVWNSDDGQVNNVIGPQLTVYPQETTTYTLTGSGLDLCNSTARVTVYTIGSVTGVENELNKGITIYPSPGNTLQVTLNNSYHGVVAVQVQSMLGDVIRDIELYKAGETVVATVEDVAALTPGIYLIQFKLGGQSFTRKWVKN